MRAVAVGVSAAEGREQTAADLYGDDVVAACRDTGRGPAGLGSGDDAVGVEYGDDADYDYADDSDEC